MEIIFQEKEITVTLDNGMLSYRVSQLIEIGSPQKAMEYISMPIDDSPLHRNVVLADAKRWLKRRRLDDLQEISLPER